MRKISNEFYQGQLTIIIFLVIFENIVSKLEKIEGELPCFMYMPILRVFDWMIKN